jgi:hypothetical protein
MTMRCSRWIEGLVLALAVAIVAAVGLFSPCATADAAAQGAAPAPSGTP